MFGATRANEHAYYITWRFPDSGQHLMVTVPYDKGGSTPGNGNMLALRAKSMSDVNAVHKLALTLGGTDEGPPGFRETHAGFYAGYFRDLDGNKVNVFCITNNAA
jgi:predicted lactoylglutathione lyase